ncbi:MAG: hypothetical protein K2O42_02405 [Oscillospiraceae bacterium]|nr:hypothetical protein [Oscillospiraceae bacterium]
MKHCKKIITAIAGVMLAGSALSVLPAYALEPIPPDVICNPPWGHEYKLENLDLHAGNVLQLEFTSQGYFSLYFRILTDDEELLYECTDGAESRLVDEWTVPKDMDAVKICSSVYSNYDAELMNYKVISESDQIYVRDAVMLVKYLHGKQMISKSEFEKLDRNQDHVVNIFDLLLVKQELIGETQSEPVQAIEFTSAVDATSAVLASGWDSAMSDENYIINSYEEFEQIITPLFRESVVKSLEEVYNSQFFEDHTLCLNLWAQDEMDDFYMQIGDVSCENQQLQINYKKEYINGFVGERKVLISQVAVPKQNYNSVNWGIEGEKSLDYEYIFSGTPSYHYPMEQESVLITDYQQFTDYAQYLTPECLERYTEEFFETKAVYFRPVEYGMLGVTEEAWNVTKSGDSITMDVKSIYPVVGCDAMMLGIGQLILDRSDAENATVSCRDYHVTDWELGKETFDGETHDYQLNATGRVVNISQYAFRGRNYIEIYLTNYFTEKCSLIQAYEMDSDFKPFTAGTTEKSDLHQGENYSISYDDARQMITIKFRTSENSDDWEVLEFPR